VVRHVKKIFPNIKLGATGISMGGLVLGNIVKSSQIIKFLNLIFLFLNR